MLMWTIAQLDRVLEGSDQYPSQWREVELGGVTMVVSPGENGMGRVERLISPNPQDYLRPEWQPGAMVSLPQTGVSKP